MHTIQSFTRQCRELQSRYRESIGEPMGVGPFRSSKNLQISMIQNGEQSGKNFLTPFAFEYAKQRISGKQKNETIEEYRLFNNLLSSQPMAFNLFCPLIQMMQEGKEANVTQIVQAIFPQIAIGRVTEVGSARSIAIFSSPSATASKSQHMKPTLWCLRQRIIPPHSRK